MDLTVVTYLLYLALTVPLTIWVARTLQRHGGLFLVDVFHDDQRLAHAVNQLLVVGFYLVNFGYVSLSMASPKTIDSARLMMELLSRKVGAVALVVGLLHYGNVWFLNVFRRRAMNPPSARPTGSWPSAPVPTGP
jgi:hypothetical protein